MIHLPILNPENRADDVEAELATDLPALGLRAGASITIRPTEAADCDALFLMDDGTLARLQHWEGRTFRKTNATGAVVIVAHDAVQVAGRVIVRGQI